MSYPEYIMRANQEMLGLNERDTSKDNDIINLGATELFNNWLVYEGIMSYSNKIIRAIEDTFRIKIPKGECDVVGVKLYDENSKRFSSLDAFKSEEPEMTIVEADMLEFAGGIENLRNALISVVREDSRSANNLKVDFIDIHRFFAVVTPLDRNPKRLPSHLLPLRDSTVRKVRWTLRRISTTFPPIDGIIDLRDGKFTIVERLWEDAKDALDLLEHSGYDVDVMYELAKSRKAEGI